jgi:hypothetical protein
MCAAHYLGLKRTWKRFAKDCVIPEDEFLVSAPLLSLNLSLYFYAYEIPGVMKCWDAQRRWNESCSIEGGAVSGDEPTWTRGVLS